MDAQTQILVEQTALLRWYVGATFVIAIATALALLQEPIRAALARADLNVSIDAIVSTPFYATLPTLSASGVGAVQHTQYQQLAHDLRLRITNTSQNAARDVEVVLERLLHRDPTTGMLNEGANVFGLNLTWSHFPGRAIMAQIASKTSRDVDLGHVLRPSDRSAHRSSGDPLLQDLASVPLTEMVLKLSTVVDPLARPHLLAPGDWEIELQVSGSNLRSRRVRVALALTGQWSDDAGTFENQGPRLRVR